MPVTLPDDPRFANDWEEQVWRALDQQLGPDDLIVVGQRVTDHKKDHEIDFVVAIEGAGIACVEVKGGHVYHDGKRWLQSTVNGPQADRSRASRFVKAVTRCDLSSRLIRDGRSRGCAGTTRLSCRDAKFSQDFALPDCPRWKVTDRNRTAAACLAGFARCCSSVKRQTRCSKCRA